MAARGTEAVTGVKEVGCEEVEMVVEHWVAVAKVEAAMAQACTGSVGPGRLASLSSVCSPMAGVAMRVVARAEARLVVEQMVGVWWVVVTAVRSAEVVMEVVRATATAVVVMVEERVAVVMGVVVLVVVMVEEVMVEERVAAGRGVV